MSKSPDTNSTVAAAFNAALMVGRYWTTARKSLCFVVAGRILPAHRCLDVAGRLGLLCQELFDQVFQFVNFARIGQIEAASNVTAAVKRHRAFVMAPFGDRLKENVL